LSHLIPKCEKKIKKLRKAAGIGQFMQGIKKKTFQKEKSHSKKLCNGKVIECMKTLNQRQCT